MMSKKQILLIAIIPALVAGAFSIAPKLYDEFSRPQANLIYKISTGPDLQTGSSNQRIYSISISNIGKKILTDIVGALQLSGGSIKNSAVDIVQFFRFKREPLH